MSIFQSVNSKYREAYAAGGSSFILSPNTMTEVISVVGNDPYIMTRDALKQAFLDSDAARSGYYDVICLYSIGPYEGHYASFYPHEDGSLKIGCQYFDPEATAVLRKWALEGMTKDEYEERHMRNQKIEGFGMETTMHMPCPFCGAPDFTVYKIFEVKDALAKGGVCKECSRGAKTVFHSSDGIVKFEMVQTEGDDAPSYVLPMRRAE